MIALRAAMEHVDWVLDAETVRELRRRHKCEDVTYRDLAAECGVSRWMVKDAVQGKTWAHIRMP